MKRLIFALMILSACDDQIKKGVSDAAGTQVLGVSDTQNPVAEKWDVSVCITNLEEEKPHYEAVIRDANGKNIQVVEGNTNAYRPIELLKPFGNVWQADVDFDGYTDIMICMGTQPLLGYKTYYDAWLYNPQTGKFDYHEGFSDLDNPEVDTVRKCVTHHYPLDSVTEQYTAFSVQKNGTLKELKKWQKKVIPYK